MAQPALQYFTSAEYLALEELAPYKSEYFNGQIFTRAGGTVNHNRIAGNISTALSNIFRDRPCEAFIGDVKLHIEQRNFYTYPDVMVVCGEIEYVENRTDTILNPTSIFEVLSDSTQLYDHQDKFGLYQNVGGLQDYIMIDQRKPRVEYFRRIDANKWLLQIYEGLEQIVKLENLGVELATSEIYRRVEFESHSLQS